MEKSAIKELLYGGISELMKNRHFYYDSGVKGYSHFTDSGKDALNEFASQMAQFITEADNKDLDKRAKELVIKGLKGDQV